MIKIDFLSNIMIIPIVIIALVALIIFYLSRKKQDDPDDPVDMEPKTYSELDLDPNSDVDNQISKILEGADSENESDNIMCLFINPSIDENVNDIFYHWMIYSHLFRRANVRIENVVTQKANTELIHKYNIKQTPTLYIGDGINTEDDDTEFGVKITGGDNIIKAVNKAVHFITSTTGIKKYVDFQETIGALYIDENCECTELIKAFDKFAELFVRRFMVPKSAMKLIRTDVVPIRFDESIQHMNKHILTLPDGEEHNVSIRQPNLKMNTEGPTSITPDDIVEIHNLELPFIYFKPDSQTTFDTKDNILKSMALPPPDFINNIYKGQFNATHIDYPSFTWR